MGKMWYTSKTLWVNVVAVAALILSGVAGFELSAEEQVSILGLINLLLRAITREAIIWTKGRKVL